MSAPAWLTNPQPAPSPPPLDERSWARLKSAQLLAIGARMSALVAEPGDPADLARLLCRAGHEAMAHHPKHGRNWWGKHSRELHALALLYARPEPAPEPTTTLLEADDEVSGEALVFVLKASFPDMVEATPMESYYRSAIVARNAEVRAFAARRMPTGADAASGARERLDGGGANG